jgi:hypothetical protein
MAVAQRAISVQEALPRRTAAPRPQSRRPLAGAVRRKARVREPQTWLMIQRVMMAGLAAGCISLAILGRVQHLQVTVQRSHLNASLRQERSKLQVLMSEQLNASSVEQIDRYARDNGFVMPVDAPIYIGGHQGGR